MCQGDGAYHRRRVAGKYPARVAEGMGVRLDGASGRLRPYFAGWPAGNIDATEMARTFNCGIGMAVIVAEPRRRSDKF